MRFYLFLLLFALSQSAFSQHDVDVTNDHEIAKDTALDVQPQYPGGIENFYALVSKNFVVPAKSKPGKVLLCFIVEKDGRLSHVKVVKNSTDRKFGKEAVRVVKLSERWKPGEKNGRTVRVLYSLPINMD